MTVQDITRLIVLPVIYTESKRCGANRTFLISFLAELSILHCNHSFFVFCFSDSGHSQPQVQSALLDRAYRERNNSGRTSGAAFHLSMLWDRRYGLPLPRWIERHDCARQWAGRYFLGPCTDSAHPEGRERQPPSGNRILCNVLIFR